MPVARIRKLGGSIALTIPAPIAREVNLEADMDVTIQVENDALIVRRARTRRTLRDFLAECDLTAPASTELAAFDTAPKVGGEIV